MQHLILKSKKYMAIGKAILNFDELGIQGDKKSWFPYPGLPYPHSVFKAEFNNLKSKSL